MRIKKRIGYVNLNQKFLANGYKCVLHLTDQKRDNNRLKLEMNKLTSIIKDEVEF